MSGTRVRPAALPDSTGHFGRFGSRLTRSRSPIQESIPFGLFGLFLPFGPC